MPVGLEKSTKVDQSIGVAPFHTQNFTAGMEFPCNTDNPPPILYCPFFSVNPILHGGGHKVPALISKIRIFATNTATATKFGKVHNARIKAGNAMILVRVVVLSAILSES